MNESSKRDGADGDFLPDAAHVTHFVFKKFNSMNALKINFLDGLYYKL